MTTAKQLANFQWPWQYDFPPFFTIQPNVETQTKQIQAWCELVLDYQKHIKSYAIDVQESLSSPLFHNAKIKRKLPIDGVYLVLNALKDKGLLEWQDKKMSRALLMWRSAEEWAKLIFNWAERSGMTNTVCTLYELQLGNDVKKEEFYEIETWVLKRALRVLEKKGKAVMFDIQPNDNDNSGGVKFLS
ncbi:uncharacterized protein TRIADDRAFT_30973 [Trichoplax adhaerens]|uniref:Vacuolar protein-sorting-associated protein 25 n=1 Tax=Trichoplax adhaerens TaxID=10228 RepID=B3S871_TRIAD|nr:hypothetical protein TRIADDRAFT_30973 [Trichoplax adhaerens]EDV21146.1 hypothetical protein TRIADDRAFT_30973 [Trichoplax adhaerens]|eukprot:XP_002116476.1 hypothetical protein TRIADDRAFT_30973 [Trichoplax adhaerens]